MADLSPVQSTMGGIVEGQTNTHEEPAENGVIFSDGNEADALEFNAGTIATIRVAAQLARLVVR